MKQLVLIAFVFIAINCTAQQTLNASGGTATISGNTHSYSIGEMSLVHTASTNTIVVTHGVLQPLPQAPDAVQNIWSDNNQVSVYPNPSTSIVNIDLVTTESYQAKYIILDMLGKIVWSRNTSISKGKNQFQYDMTPWANANYLLQVQLKNRTKDYSKYFKIQKIK